MSFLVSEVPLYCTLLWLLRTVDGKEMSEMGIINAALTVAFDDSTSRGALPDLLGLTHTCLRITRQPVSAAILCAGGPDVIRKKALSFY